MLTKLVMEGVGPADRLALNPLAPRANLIVGDNGLGKSFLLDMAWWALTRTWAGYPAMPIRKEASISFAFDGKTKASENRILWDPQSQSWKRKPGRPPNPGLVIYAGVHGTFSVWDPARNYALYKMPDGSQREAPPAYHFSPSAVMDGLRSQDGTLLCRGLIDDWTRWMAGTPSHFDVLCDLLRRLSEDPEHPMRPGPNKRPYFLTDVRDIPTITTPYQQDVPIIYAPAGTQRIVKLAYLLTWAIVEHAEASERLGLPLSRQVTLLLDEPETHLHPRWQRMVLPALLGALHNEVENDPKIQLITATHSPLILASMEPIFSPDVDALWKLDLVNGAVRIERDEWLRRGEISSWLTSDVFDLGMARSLPAEDALREAMGYVRSGEADQGRILAISEKLSAVLSDTDRAWVRWAAFARDHGVDI